MIAIFVTTVLNFIFFLIFYNFFSTHIGLIDKPNERKIHKGLVPLTGGLIIFSSLIVSNFYIQIPSEIITIFMLSIPILLIGLIDDLFEVHYLYRIIVQLLVILLLIGFNIYVVDLGKLINDDNFLLGAFSIPLTFLAVIGLTNSFNFIDGLDGLCSGLSIISISSILVYTLIFSGFNIYTDFLIVLIISISLFFIFNLGFLKGYKIFLGDSGSTIIGFILSCLLILFTMPSIRLFPPILVIWFVAIPIFDLVNVVLDRIINKTNPFLPDRNHIHHILIRMNFNKYSILIFIFGSQIILSIIGGLIYYFIGNKFSIIIYLFCFFIYKFIINKINAKQLI